MGRKIKSTDGIYRGNTRTGVITSTNQNAVNECKKELKKYDILNNKIFNELAESLNAFRTGNIDTSIIIDNDDFGQLLVCDIFNVNANSLNNYKYNKLIFNDYLDLGHKVLDGLKESKRLVKKYNATKKSNERYKDILKDKDSIKQYILDNFTGSNLFGDAIKVQLTEVPKVKKEYMIYIERYGFPENAIFKSELISEIIKELNEEC